jgi:CheY-like chemotaxis protein
LLGLGYTTDVAVSCRELFARAAASPDVEVIVVDARMPQPPVGEFVQAMRQDARTCEIPIAILTSSERDLNPNVTAQRRNTMTRFDRRSPDSPFRSSLSLNYPRVASAESAQWVVEDLLDKTEANPVSPSVRLEQAKQALVWLRETKEAELQSGVKIYHFDDFDSVVLSAMRSEGRYKEGLELAAVVKSPVVQLALYDWAANGLYPIKLRELAGQAFEQSVESFGVLLRGQQVQAMYDRYNRSEFEEKESQELLSRLIDVVKAKVERK